MLVRQRGIHLFNIKEQFLSYGLTKDGIGKLGQ